MGLIRRWRRSRSAKRIARLLPEYLARSYGASEFYTPAQINASLARCRIDSEDAEIALSRFLPFNSFREICNVDDPMYYGALRALFERHLPSGRNIYAFENVMSESVRQLITQTS